MGVGVRIEVNERQMRRFFQELSARELPFAMSLAMNTAAAEARDHVRREVPKRFTVRSRGVLRGFTFNPSHKRQWPNLRVEIGTRDEFWVLHETGGVKRPEQGMHLAIPTRLVRRTKAGRISKAQRPRPLIAAGKATKLEGVIRRTSKRKAERVSMLYLLRREARIRPKLGLRGMVHSSMRRYFPLAFHKAMNHAVSTSRDRALRTKG